MSGVRRTARGAWRQRVVLALAAVLTMAVVSVAWAAKGELSYNQRIPEYDVSRASGVVSSPDGNNLYVTGGDSITVLSRNATTGAFTYIESEVDGLDDPTDAGGVVDGLANATGLAISADGKHVYASGRTDDAIAVFARDATTGKLSFVEFERNNVDDLGDSGGTVTALNDPEAVAVSPDGESVYAAADSGDAVVAFERDATTGKLSYLESEVDGVNDAGDPGGTVDGMNGPSGVAVAPDSEAVYVTASTDDSVVAFQRDTGTGELNYLEFEDDGVNDATDAGGTVNGLNGAEDVTVAPGNNAVFVSGDVDSAVAVFDRDTATEKLSFIEAEVQGVDDTDVNDPGPTVAGMAGPSGLALSPAGANLYVAGSSSDAVAVFRWVPADDELVFREAETDGVDDGTDPGGAVTGLSRPKALTVTPDGDHLYVGTFDDPGLAAFDRQALGSPTFGSLSFLLSAPPISLPDPRGVAVSPDGRHLFVATNLPDSSLYSFIRDPATGSVTLFDTETEGVDDPSDAGGPAAGIYEAKAVAVSPDGAHVYVTDTSTYSVSAYRLDASGELTYLESEIDGVNDAADPGGTVDGLYEGWDVVVSPDGGGVYVAANNDDGVSAFTRTAATGTLSFVEAELDNVGGNPLNSMTGTEALAISPDGKNIYVAARDVQAASVFSRDPGTNALSFVEVERQGDDDASDPGGTVDGLDNGPDDVVVSPDGAQVYFLSSTKVAVFDRDATTGRLSFSEVEENGVDDPGDPGGTVDGLLSGRVVTTSADGGEVYAAGTGGAGALVTFSRDKATGKLSFLEVEREGVDDPTDAGGRAAGLGRIEAMAVAPDDRNLYAVAEFDHSLTIFDREDDFVAPDTSITGGPDEGSTTSDPTPAFTFGSDEDPVTFTCSVDGGSPSACPAELPALADGAHSLSATATDAEGNTDSSPATRSFSVDATAPETTITVGPQGPTKSDPSFAFASSEPGSTFECRLDSASFAPCTSPRAYGSLDDDDHTFRVRAVDGAGNKDGSPAAREFTLDTKVDGVDVDADKKQKIKGSKIKVKVDVEAAEGATADAGGTIEVPKGHSKKKKKSYKLADVSKDLLADTTKTLKLKPKKSKNKRKIADALKDRKKVKAKIEVTISDDVGNEVVKSKTVKLKRK
jgi:DNA-binding beta-propeller fold protein YncE